MTFGEKLKHARKDSGYSQEELANILCLSRSAIAKWESDKGMPDITNLKLISQTLSVSVDYLLTDENVLSMNVIREPIDLDGMKVPAGYRLLAKDRKKDAIVRKNIPTPQFICCFMRK